MENKKVMIYAEDVAGYEHELEWTNITLRQGHTTVEDAINDIDLYHEKYREDAVTLEIKQNADFYFEQITDIVAGEMATRFVTEPKYRKELLEELANYIVDTHNCFPTWYYRNAENLLLPVMTLSKALYTEEDTEKLEAQIANYKSLILEINNYASLIELSVDCAYIQED